MLDNVVQAGTIWDKTPEYFDDLDKMFNIWGKNRILVPMNKNLVIENLPANLGSSEVTALISPLGKVNWVYIRELEGKSDRVAYIEMADKNDAARVIVKWNGAELSKRVLRVKYVDINLDRLSAMSGVPVSNIKPSDLDTHQRFFQPRLDVRNLADLARVLTNKESTIVLYRQQKGLSWTVIIGVMLLLGLLGYALYRYTS